jgi:hypothetical protein
VLEGNTKVDHPVGGSKDVADACFIGSTKIPLLDGTEKSIKEIVESEKEHWVYSCTDDGRIVPGEVIGGECKGYKDIIRIVLDNNEIIECTPEHRFMLRDGSYKEAKDLNIEDSLMPLYRRLSIAGENGRKEVTLHNHKIKSIEYLNKKEKVYDIEVKKYHNFALKAGVFVHNCAGSHAGMLRNASEYRAMFSELFTQTTVSKQPTPVRDLLEGYKEKHPSSGFTDAEQEELWLLDAQMGVIS